MRPRAALPLLCAVLGVSVWPERALADTVPRLPKGAFQLGPSVAYGMRVRAADHPVFGLDASYSYLMFWGGGGVRLLADEGPTVLPYVEAGAWLGVNIGVGCSLLANNPRRQVLATHLFLGFPWPVSGIKIKDTEYPVYLEPYYRPMWWSGTALHELGLLLKITTWDY
jgi:hypothetical protein